MTPEQLYNKMYAERPANDVSLEETILFAAAMERLQPGAIILDVGCGAGTVACQLKKNGFRVIGIDHSPVAVELATKIGIECYAVDVDKQDLPFDGSTFDAAWAGDVIEHVFDPIGLLRKIKHVLRPGGLIFISVPNELPLRTRCRVLLNGRSVQTYVYNRFEIDHHHTHFTQDLVELVIRKAGLTQIVLGGVVRLPMGRKERYSTSRGLSRWFGRTFVALAEK